MELRYFNLSTGLLFFILAIILFFIQSPNKKSNLFLGLLFVLITIYTQLTFLHYSFIEKNNVSALSWYFPVDGLIFMLMSPVLFFYVLSLLGKPVRIMRWRSILYLLPLLPCFIFNLLFLFWPVSERINWLRNDFYFGSWQMNVINVVLYLQIMVYLFISYKTVQSHQKISPYVVKNGYRTNVTWVKLFLLTNLIITIVSLPVCFYINNERTSILIGQTAMNVDLLFLFIMTALKIGNMDTEKVEEEKPSYQMNKEQAVGYWEIIGQYMDSCKPYRDENCSLRLLSEQTNIPKYQLSKTLNSHGGISFSDFVNEYRLKEATILLTEQSKHRKTIDAIAIDCGFGSRNSFYRAFKKQYGITPATYRKNAAGNR